MSISQQSSGVRRKAWAVIAIILSILVILISASGIIGSWIIGNTLSSTSVRLLVVVENTAAGVRNIAAGLDQDLRQVQEIVDDIQAASTQISENAADKALVLTLLPEGREGELVERTDGLIKTLTTVRNVIAAGLELYQTVDSLPFVSLPSPEQEAVSELEKGAGEIRSAAQDLASGVADFRSGRAARIDRVVDLAERVDDRLGASREGLADLDSDLIALQEWSDRWQRILPLVYGFASLLLTLFFAYVLYTQVVAVRVFMAHLREKAPPAAVEMPTEPEEAVPPEPVEEPTAPMTEGPAPEPFPEPEALPDESLSSGSGSEPDDIIAGSELENGETTSKGETDQPPFGQDSA